MDPQSFHVPEHPRAFVASVMSKWSDTISRMRASGRFDSKHLDRIQSFIVDGIKFDFKGDLPPPAKFANTPSVSGEAVFVAERLAQYLYIDAVEECEEDEYVQSLHCISKPGKKPRLVLDLSRNLNDFIDDESLRYATVEEAARQLAKYDFLGKLDNSDAFLSFDIHPDFRRFLAFRFHAPPGSAPSLCKNKSGMWRFKKLPFGLKSAPAICTFLFEVVAFAMEELGIRHIRYLDDWLFWGKSADEVRANMQAAIDIFSQFGLLTNKSKIEGPAQRLSFLGIQLDTVSCTMELTKDRLVELRQLIADFGRKHTTQAHTLATLAGKFSFAATVLPGARAFMRSMFELVASAKHRFHYITLTSAFHADMAMWNDLLHLWDGKASWRRPFSHAISCDASGDGFCYATHDFPPTFSPPAFSALPPPSSMVAGYFSGADVLALADPRIGISWHELFSVYAALVHNSDAWRDQNVTVWTDNLANVSILNKLSSVSNNIVPLLQAITLFCTLNNISLRAHHVPGAINDLCDYGSRPELHRFSFDCLSLKPRLCSSSSIRHEASISNTASQFSRRFADLLAPAAPVAGARRAAAVSSKR